MGGVPPTYNVPGVTAQLKFTGPVLAGIYLGTITKWNDARIAADNPGVRLPDMDVVVVHRSDGSGTSFIFTDYLSKVSPEWASKVGKGTAVNWPVGLGAKGSEGVSATVQQTPGAIGYVELGYALANHLPVGAVKNKAGKFVAASAASVTAAAASAMKAMGASTDFRVSITDPDGADAYPISSFTWMLVRKDYDDAAKAKALVAYTWWALTTGQGRCDELGYAPIPKAMQPWLEARLKTITASGTAVWSGPAGR
jgi:phosphate transport system substrate-binding protein